MFHSRSTRRCIFLLGIAALATGCSGSDAGNVSSPPPAPIEQLVVTISPRVDSLLLGATRQLTASVRTSTGLDRNVPIEFTSLSPEVVTVRGASVTAIATGQARIVARAGTASDTATLIVTPPLIELRLEPGAVAATLGDTISFKATIVGPGGAVTQTTSIAWSLSDSSTARLVGDGAVTTTGVGELQVIAQVGGISAYAAVMVQSAPVASLSISPSNLAMSVGARAQLVPEPRDSRGRLIKGVAVEWSSSNSEVAAVNEDGAVKALAQGGAVITARANGRRASAAVNVASAAASSVAITLPNDSLGTSRTMQAMATPMDANGNPITGRPLAWQSSNPAVATVNSSGLVTGIVAGQTTLSVICDGRVSSQKITIAVPVPTILTVTPATALLLAGSTSSLAGEVRDQFGVVLTGKTLSWTSTAPSVVSVNSVGQVVGVAFGTATVRASSGALVGSSTVTVQNVPVASLTVTPPSPSVEEGSSIDLNATTRDVAGNVLLNRPVVWSSSSTTVAQVSATGSVLGVSVGSATITATAEGKSQQVTVAVTAPPPPSVAHVTVTLNSPVLGVGEATKAIAYAYDENGLLMSSATPKFTSQDTTTASVAVDGRVQALRAGSTTIVAEVDGEIGIASVTVQPPAPLPVTNVVLSVPVNTLVVGDSTQLSVALRDANGALLTGRTLAFTSSSNTILSVNATGLLRAKSAGSATIIATSEGKSASVTVTVTAQAPPPPSAPAPVALVSVSLAASSLDVGQTTQGTVTLKDSVSNVLTGRTIAWSSSNTSIATVAQNGLVSAVAAGTATITVQSEGKSGSAILTVKTPPPPPPPVVKTVQVTLNNTTVTVGGTARDSAGGVMSGQSVAWAVTTGSIVASLSGGTAGTTTATGMSGGSATIKATVGGISASASLTVQAAAPPPTSVAQPAQPALLNFNYPTVTGKSWPVRAGDNLQTTLNNAQRGDEIVIQAGASFQGTFTLPAKSGTSANGWILVRSDKSAQLPAMGTRVTPSHASLMPRLVSMNAAAALQTATSASGWWISGIEITLDPSLKTNYGLVLLGNSGTKQNTLAMVPTDLVLDRVYVHASPTTPTSRCVALNSARSQISDSYLFDCHGKGFDTQAIAGWNGPGPFKIVNNTLAGAGENVMFGGSDPSIKNLIPSDIEFRRNYVYTPASWKNVWTKKNLLETKNVQRLLVEGNVFDGSWVDAQVGWAFILKSSNQGGACTWCASRDITFRNNIIRNAGAGFNLAGHEGSNPYPVGEQLTRVLIEGNIVENINTGIYDGEAKFIQVLQNLKELTVRSNTMTAPGSFTQFFSVGSAPAATNVDFQNNVVTHGQYGLFSSAAGTGEGALSNLAGLVVWQNYVMIGTSRGGYPHGTFAPDLTSALQSGRGANQSVVNAATAGVIIP
ncbi:MAG: Ig-like domain-containing protein [Gemmatimonadota bacterium]